MHGVADIEPTDGCRNNWYYKTFKRVGCAEGTVSREITTYNIETGPRGGRKRVEHRVKVVAELFGVYGVRGDEIFVQYEGFRDADGAIYGVSLMSSSVDMETYFWTSADRFADVRISAEFAA